LGSAPVRSHLVYELVQLDRDYTSESREQRWDAGYAERLLERFGRGERSARTCSVARLSASSASTASKSSCPCSATYTAPAAPAPMAEPGPTRPRKRITH